MTLEVMTKHLQDAMKQVTEGSMNNRNQKVSLQSQYKNDLIVRFNKLFEIMMNRQIPLSSTEIEDFDGEFHRLYDLKQIYLQASSFNCDIRQHARGSQIFTNLMEVIDNPCRKYDSQIENAVKHLLQVEIWYFRF